VITISYEFIVANPGPGTGDLLLQGSSLALTSGAQKLIQDLNLWLVEEYGVDRFHITYGSLLESFIGSIMNTTTLSKVQSEVFRVLQNYQKLQNRQLKTNPNLLSLSELLQTINNVSASISQDTVIVQVNVSNAAGQAATITASTSVA
jgi:hypothetical protein